MAEPPPRPRARLIVNEPEPGAEREPAPPTEPSLDVAFARAQADPRTAPLAAFCDTRRFAREDQIAIKVRMVKDIKQRLRDPRTPRHIRWMIRAMTALLVAPFVVYLAIAVVDRIG